jgi:hypothetical protein
MSDAPDPDLFVEFATDVVPGWLVDVVNVDAERASAVGADILIRGYAVAALTPEDRRTVSMPFFEETFHYEPEDATDYQRALVAVAVRNSALEPLHVDGVLQDGGIKVITSAALAPLSHLVGAADRGLLSQIPAEALILAETWRRARREHPRAWASFEALAALSHTGDGHAQLRGLRDAPHPAAPIAAADSRRRDDGAIVMDAMDPRFDQHTVDTLIDIAEADSSFLVVPTLSRFSREFTKLCTTEEYLLSADVDIVTSNYLLRAKDTWVRRHSLVRTSPVGLSEDLHGLTGAHRRMYETALAWQIQQRQSRAAATVSPPLG